MADFEVPRIPRRNRKDDDPKMIGLWKVGRTIGKGSSGRVRIARHSKTGQYAAVKIVSKHALLSSRMSVHNLPDEAERILHGIEREIVIMKLIEHPNIMQLYDVWETSTELFLILEYVEGGELFEYLCNKGRLSITEALQYFQQIITAVDYCHRFNIAHRDLKPENLLLDRDRNIKVADFGMAAWQGKTDMLQTACGSPHYAAPEVIMGRAYNGTSSDIWSCGIILYALLAGRLPFDDEDLPTLLERVKVGKYTMPSDIDPRAKDLITKMLEKDVAKRITIPEILKHPFYNSQSPKEMSCGIPNLDDIARPLEKSSDADPDILANLRTLWPGVSDTALMANLTNEKSTWEKGVYHLLIRYRAKHLENYDEEEETRLAKARARRRQKKAAASRSRNEDAFLSLPPRTGPPTPRRASRGADPAESPIAGPSRIRQLPILGSGIINPETTPTNSSPDPNSPTSSSGATPHLPALDVPEVQDEKIQHFFQQIVNHLNVMQTAGLGTPIVSRDPALSPIASKAPPPTPLTVDLGRPFVRKREGDIDGASSADTFAFGQARNGNSTRPLSIRPRSTVQKDKENAQLSPSSYLKVDDAHERKSSLRSNGSSVRTDKRVQIAEPDMGGRSKLRKRRSALGSPIASAFSVSDGGSFSFASTPKRSWFGHFFKFKPTTYQLISSQDAYHTRQECRRLLENMGLSVILTQSEGMGVLKCKLEESRDPAGVMHTVRGVRFRVEVHRPTTVQSISGFTVALNLIMEKGALSSFRLVYNRLRREWDLDNPPTGYTVESRESSPVFTDDERFVEVVYSI